MSTQPGQQTDFGANEWLVYEIHQQYLKDPDSVAPEWREFLADLPDGALDCDLGFSPLTNTMPILRHGLHRGGAPVDLIMAWVSVPDLAVHPMRQRYTPLRAGADRALIRYEHADSSFTADLTFDRDGLVLHYPKLMPD